MTGTTTTMKTSDRRRAPRTPLNTHGQLLVCPADNRSVPIPVTFKDASATGIGVVAQEPLALGHKYVVKEQTLSKREAVLFTVVRTRALDDHHFFAGLHATHLMRQLEAADASQRGASAAGAIDYPAAHQAAAAAAASAHAARTALAWLGQVPPQQIAVAVAAVIVVAAVIASFLY
jgi:hypothetical protein